MTPWCNIERSSCHTRVTKLAVKCQNKSDASESEICLSQDNQTVLRTWPCTKLVTLLASTESILVN